MHASRRTSPAVRHRRQVRARPYRSSSRNASSVTVTRTVAASPPCTGSRFGSTASSSEQNACPRLRSTGIRSPSPTRLVSWGGECLEVGGAAGLPRRRARLMMIRVVPSPSRLLTRSCVRSARRLLRGELLGLVLLADLGGDDAPGSADPAPAAPRGPNSAACGDQVSLRARRGTSAETCVGRQLVKGAGDHLRLRHVQVAVRPSAWCRPGAPAPVQRLSERRGRAGWRRVVACGCGGSRRAATSRAPSAIARSSAPAISRSLRAAPCASMRLNRISRRFWDGAMNTTGTSATSLRAASMVARHPQHRVGRSAIKTGAHRTPPGSTSGPKTSGSHVSMQRACEQRTSRSGPIPQHHYWIELVFDSIGKRIIFQGRDSSSSKLFDSAAYTRSAHPPPAVGPRCACVRWHCRLCTIRTPL